MAKNTGKIILLSIMSIITKESVGKINCKTSGGNFLNLTTQDMSFDMTEKRINFNVEIYPIRVRAYILERERYSHLVYPNFGMKPRVYIDEKIPPEHDEALKWYNNKKCYYGTICVPDGDCWGSGAEKCMEKEFKNSAIKRDYAFKGSLYTAHFRDTCTQDYSCSITEKDLLVEFDSDYKPKVTIGNKEISLHSNNPLIYATDGFFSAIIENTIQVRKEFLDGRCIDHKGKLYCDILIDGVLTYIEIERTKFTTVIGNMIIYCGKHNINDMPSGSTKSASLEDLNKIAQAVAVIEAKENYNTYVQNKINVRNAHIINNLIISESAQDPLLLSRIVKKNIMAVPTNRFSLLEVYRCDGHEDYQEYCDNFNKVHGTKMKCRVETTDNVEKLDVLGLIPSSLTFFDNIKFEGVDKTIYEDYLEKEFNADIHYQGKEDNSSFDFKFPSLFSMVSDNLFKTLTIINTGIILLLLIRR